MEKPEKVKTIPQHYLFWIIIALLIVLSYFIIKPFIIALITAFILAYLCKPLYDKINKKLPRSVSAAICILLVLIIIFIPLGAVAGGITKQASAILNEKSMSTLLQKASSYPVIANLNLNLDELTKKAISLIISWFTSLFSQIPVFILSLLIILFGVYYILIDWNILSGKLKQYLPFENKEAVARDISRITNNLVYGTLLIGLIEFVIAFFGFYISGVGPHALLAALIFFFAFIPGIGPAVAWVPAGIYYFATGNMFTMVGVIITGLILSVLIDTLLRPKILGQRAKINPFITLVGIIGGISLFGIFGFILGPLILVYTIRLVEESVKQ